jgi:hypothetical protein
MLLPARGAGKPAPGRGRPVTALPSRSRVRARALVTLALLLCSAWFFAALLFAREVIFDRDVFSVWHAQVEAVVRAVAEGSLPLWDPHASFGEPLLEFATQMLYPPSWLALIMPAGAFYSLSVFAHHVFGGAGLYWFLRAQALTRAAALTGALLWMSSGALLSVANMLNLFAGSAWMPWVLLASERARRDLGLGASVVWGAAVAACFLTGSEAVLMAGGASAAWFVWSPATGSVLRRAGSAAVALGAALLLSAAQWLPLFALLRQTSRTDLPYAVRTFWSLHPMGVLQLAFPFFPQDLGISHAADLADVATPLLHSVFLGAPALSLCVAGVFRRPRRAGLFLAAAAALAIAFALGRHAFAYDLAVALLPPLRSLRYPVKACLFATLALSALAGFGLDAIERGEARARRGALAALAALWLGLLIGVFVATPLGQLAGAAQRRLDPTAAAVLRGFAGALLASAVFAFALVRPGRPARLALAAAALAAVALPAVRHRSLNPTADAGVLRYRPPLIDAIRRDGGTRVFSRTRPRDTALLVERRAVPAQGLPPRLAAVLNYKQILLPDVARLFGLSSSYEIDIRGAQSRELIRLSLPVLGSDEGPWVLRLLQLGAVSHVVTLDPRVPQGLELLRVDRTLLGDTVWLYRVPSPLPRCYVAAGVRRAADDVALGQLLSGDFDIRREIVSPDLPARAALDREAGTCRVVRFGTSSVAIEVTASSDAFAILVDAYMPSWTASVDGVPAAVHRANLAFRAVAVPAGRHEVVFRYRPRAVGFGLLASTAGALLAVGALALERRFRARAQAPAAGEVARHGQDD